MTEFELYCIDAAIELTYDCSELVDDLKNGMSFSEIEEVIRKHAWDWATDFTKRRDVDEDPLWDEVGERHISLTKDDLVSRLPH